MAKGYTPIQLQVKKITNDFVRDKALEMMFNRMSSKIENTNPINDVLLKVSNAIARGFVKSKLPSKTTNVNNIVNNNNDINNSSNMTDYIPSYMSDLRIQENSTKAGYNSNTNTWSGIPSPEGGPDTVGYGIKLNPGTKWTTLYNKQGFLTDEQVNQALREEIINAKNKASKSFNSMTGGDFNKLSIPAQQILNDLAYNIGTINTYPKFVKSLYNNDRDVAFSEYERFYTDSAGVKQPLKARNAYTKKLLEQMIIDDNFKSYGD